MAEKANAGYHGPVAGVRILNAPYSIDKEYDYAVPSPLEGSLRVGAVVVVPFGGGNRHVFGIVSSLKDKTDIPTVKPVAGVPEGGLCIGEELYGLCEFMKERFFCTVGEAAKTVLPAGLSVKTNLYYTAVEGANGEELNEPARQVLQFIRQEKQVTPARLRARFEKSAACLKRLVAVGAVEKHNDVNCRLNTKNDRFVRLLLDAETLSEQLSARKSDFTKKQLCALSVLASTPQTPVSELCEIAQVGESVVKELEKKGAVSIVPIPKDRNPYEKFAASEPLPDFTLTDEQQKAYETLHGLYAAKEPKAALLYGVTGSGKTNVMLKLTDDCVRDKKGVIVLVPEIALTAQAVGIFMRRYGDRVAVLHSGLSAGERLDAWRRIRDGKATVVLGTRSAVFAPVKDLGMIAIDEEQESSFKSDMTPKYHARDVARYRCAATSSLMLLSSATPSVESYHKAKKGVYTLVTLKERYGKYGVPKVQICDMREEEPTEATEGTPSLPRLLSRRLYEELANNLEKGEQSVLFINRRGYRAFLSCRKCGYVMECPNCSVSLTYHKYGFSHGGKMMCHYCGYTHDVPSVCPVCGSEHLSALGNGTQMLEEQLKEAFPSARILRMDTDTTSGKFSHDAILESFRNKEADILLGTQMVTKGHDFGGVSLVGVVSADASLHLPDFRANERTFALLTQVIGRAGRAEIPGRAFIQTYTPDHEVLLLSQKQDYERFFDSEIKLRKAALYPPFCDMALVTFTSENESDVRLAASKFGKRLDELCKGPFGDVQLIVFGPFEAGIYKMAGRYRLRYVVKCRNGKRTRELLSALYREFLSGTQGDLSMSVDMDPQNV